MRRTQHGIGAHLSTGQLRYRSLGRRRYHCVLDCPTIFRRDILKAIWRSPWVNTRPRLYHTPNYTNVFPNGSNGTPHQNLISAADKHVPLFLFPLDPRLEAWTIKRPCMAAILFRSIQAPHQKPQPQSVHHFGRVYYVVVHAERSLPFAFFRPEPACARVSFSSG